MGEDEGELFGGMGRVRHHAGSSSMESCGSDVSDRLLPASQAAAGLLGVGFWTAVLLERQSSLVRELGGSESLSRSLALVEPLVSVLLWPLLLFGILTASIGQLTIAIGTQLRVDRDAD